MAARIKVTLTLPPEVARRGKAVALAQHKTLGDVVASGLGREVAALTPEVAKTVEAVERALAGPSDAGGDAGKRTTAGTNEPSGVSK